MTITVNSSAFDAGAPIPKKYAFTGEGDNVSPQLSWTGAPAGVKTFALTVDDPDAPSPLRPRPNPWVHWVLWNIPGDKTSLDDGESGGGVSGTSDFGQTGWGGPMPPPGSGTHRYFFKVYALDTSLNLPSSATKTDLLAAMEGHILAEGSMHGTYQR
jgi:Raf kinase inhibitor-like YbhB/YbcL family protein